jgi:anti-anti-sigma factor
MTAPSPAAPLVKSTTLAEYRWDGSVLTVRLVGPSVGQRESPIVGADLTAMLAESGERLRHLVFDLTDVTFMSSMGLGVLIAARNECARRKVQPLLTGLRPDLLKVFAMMKLDKMFRICAGEAELRKALGR